MKFQNIKYLLFFIASCSFAQAPTAFFNEDITAHADAVIQKEAYTVTLSQEKQTVQHSATISILNEAADYLGSLTIFYDKDTKINNLKMTVYDANGKVLKKVKRKDFNDYSATGNSNLYTDNRVIQYEYLAKNYPYTIAYSYEIISKNTAHIMPWIPITAYNVSVLKSSYSLKHSAAILVNKLAKNFKNYGVKEEAIANGIKYHITNVKAIKEEALSPDLLAIVPSVYFASNKFQLAGVKGQASNWEDFGKWMNKELLITRNNLSDDTKAKIHKLVANEKDPIKRARLIYDYVQKKTRYISVQIGIGGWMPMLTDDVDKLGYGDCKALTYYTKSLLDIAGVPSYYTIVYAGDYKRDIAKDLVSVQGNHAFLCLPTAKDTIWLECTSQKVPFGYVNSFTDDRDVLVINENGAKIKHTSKNKDADNLQKTIMNYTLSPAGELSGDAAIISTGTQYHTHLNIFDNLKPDDLENTLKKYYDANDITFSKIRVDNNKVKKQYEEDFSFAIPNFAKKYTATSLVFMPNPINRITYIPKKITNRKLPLLIARGYQDVDDYSITLPEGYHLAKLPAAVSEDSKFGTYKRSFTWKDDKLIFHRAFLLKNGEYPKEAYDAYRKFRKKISKYEQFKLMITK